MSPAAMTRVETEKALPVATGRVSLVRDWRIILLRMCFFALAKLGGKREDGDPI